MGEARSVPRRGLEAHPGEIRPPRRLSEGRSRSPMAGGSRRERTSPPPSLARFTGGSSLSSSSKYRAGLFAARARARLGTSVPHLRPPVSDRDSSDLLLPSRREIFARPGAREPTARPPRDHSADADSDRVYFAPTQIPMAGVARPRTCGRARDGPLTPRDENPASQGTTRQAVVARPGSVKSEPGRRALETCASLRAPPLGIVKDDSL